MFWSFCSAKGGVGTSVIAATIASELARGCRVLLLDLCDDQPDLLGLAETQQPGVRDWLQADDDVDTEALLGLAEHVSGGLHLLRAGTDGELNQVAPNRSLDVVTATSSSFDVVVADLGVARRGAFDTATVIAAAGDRTALVVRACYLALRKSSRLSIEVDDLVEVVEGGRALQTVDIEAVFGRPLTARVPLDPAIARAADAGTLTSRAPRVLRRSLGGLLDQAMPIPASMSA